MKKRYWILIVASLLVCIFAFSGCGLFDKPTPDKDNGSTNDKQFQAVYALYLDYAESKGETPLSYENWLKTIKGEDGKDGSTPVIGYNGNWWIDNVDTGVPATGKDGVNGTNGKDGADGVGIKNVSIDENGNLLITYTDGTTETVAITGTTNGCVHSYGEWTRHSHGNILDFACGEILSYRTCSKCANVEWRNDGYVEHDFEFVHRDPTCDAEGYDAEFCNVCGYYKITEIPTIEHDLTFLHKDATCYAEGYDAEFCNVCGYTKITDIPKSEHVTNNNYISNYEYHWKECSYCGTVINKEYHTLNDSDICSVCSKLVSDNSKYPWSRTTLTIQISENSNHQELPSTCRRYLAGDLTGVSDRSTIDDYVAERNEEALKETNVEVRYDYLPDTAAYSWGENINTITEEVRSKRDGRPDVYVNFVYDMVAASLQGAFANLLSTTMYEDGHKLAGAEHNYFEFTDPTFVDSGDGYMIEYMRSLTLSKHKMYCLSSDYFTDIVRAFLVVPVSIGLLETLTVDDSTTHLKDRVTTLDASGNIETNYTIEDFYQLVYNSEWNYETLAKFSQSIVKDEAGEINIDLRDTVGFALGTGSNLPASGLLYTTSITIIDREYNATKGDYVYSYPYINAITDANGKVTSFERDKNGTHDELIAFCNNLNTLFQTEGVIAVSKNDIFTFGYAGGEATDLSAIRERFAAEKVLFGGIICLGSLEYDEYKDMNGPGGNGYGIVPVPLYRTNYEEYGETKVDNYLTQIHNIGKIGAISYTTENFAQCTAYLNYMSTHSTDILNEYYDYKLQYDVVGTGVKGNVDMLKYIRKNVRSSFDKAFEDALGRFYSATDEESMNQQWHTMIKNANYQISAADMAWYYDCLTPVKAWRLYNLENSIYPSLPN